MFQAVTPNQHTNICQWSRKGTLSAVSWAEVVKNTQPVEVRHKHGMYGTKKKHETCLLADEALSISTPSLELYYFITLDGIPNETKRLRDAAIKKSVCQFWWACLVLTPSMPILRRQARSHVSEFHKSNSEGYYSGRKSSCSSVPKRKNQEWYFCFLTV